MTNNKHAEIRLNVAKDLCESFVKAFPATVISFIVYGSVANGSAKQESDIDIQIICDKPNSSIQKQGESLIVEAQNNSGFKIVVNAKTPSYIIEELVQGDTFHVLMFLQGICLLKSKMFDSLRQLVYTAKLPNRSIIENKIRVEINNWSEELLHKRLVNFVSDCSLSIFQFLAFERVSQNNFENWMQQENKIQRASNHTPHIQELLPSYAECLESFLITNKGISVTDCNLENARNFDLIELLKCMSHIHKKTQINL